MRRSPRFLLWIVLSLPGLAALLPSPAAAQAGRIAGRVSDVMTGEGIAGVSVAAPALGREALTDLDGRFVLTGLPAGSHSVTVAMLGYSTKTVTGVEVEEGRTTALPIGLDVSVLNLESLTVSAERERGSATFLLDQRRTSNALVEAVGADEISRRPDSDAADVARRMTGVTVTEGRYVFVRGLGERYSQTSLNGSSLPSPEPEREVVPLDLFPAGALESLETQKSYTPDQPADFAGGSIHINTMDFPSEFRFRFGVGTTFNTASQFQDDYLHYAAGGTDWLGFDNGTRGQPTVLEESLGGVRSGQRLPSDASTRVAIGEALRGMEPAFGPNSGRTPMNRSFDLSVGGSTRFRDEGELGYFVSGTYSDEYRRRDGEIERKWRADAFREGTAELSTPNVDYVFGRGLRNVSWGTLGNVTFRPNLTQKVSLRTMATLNTDDEARTYAGENNEDIGGDVLSERSRFVERLLLWGQLSGEHSLFLSSRLDWRLTAGRANRDEPLMREAIYQRGTDNNYYLYDTGESGRYFYSSLIDDDRSVELDWRFPFGFLGGEAAVKVGGAWRERGRDFGARRLNWQFLGGLITDLDSALANGVVVSSSPSAANEFAIDDIVEPGDVYHASDTRGAGYLMFSLPLGARFKAVLGARMENYSLELVARDSTLAEQNQTDLAPSLNLTYSPLENVRVRGALSRTVDRPEFRELAPFQFTEATSLRQLVGNPRLESAEITSADLRVDWFPAPGEIISAGGFYKRLTDPIEQVFIAAASSAYSFQNAEEADIYGLELDVQLRLDRLADALEFFAIQGNYSWIQSEVTVVPGGIYQPTNARRPLQGQASYVLNTGLNFASPSGFEAGVFFNRFGERVEAGGGSGVPDIYEQPRSALDASVAFPLAWNVRARVKGTNLLDSEYVFAQSANGYTRIQRKYSVGQTYSIGLSWEF